MPEQRLIMSHPSWVCGLKLEIERNPYSLKQVTPFVGVWIETISELSLTLSLPKSHPSWVCGLKLMGANTIDGYLCHTLRGCVD